MKVQTRRAGITLILLFALAPSLEAQRILDWPIRSTAEPEAVTRGALAAFWNPAAISSGPGRGEILVADQRAPDIVGVKGFAVAAAWRLEARTVIAAGYQHVAVGDIGETSTSPLPDAGSPAFSVREDRMVAGVSHVLGSILTAGATVRYERSNESGADISMTSLGAGAVAAFGRGPRPVVGVTVLTQSGGVRYVGGAEVSSAISQDLRLRGGWGIRGGENMIAVEQRAGMTMEWREVVAVTGGVSTANPGAGRSWEPVLGASLRLSRYELGVLRETLANDFGAAYSFRFRFGLK